MFLLNFYTLSPSEIFDLTDTHLPKKILIFRTEFPQVAVF